MTANNDRRDYGLFPQLTNERYLLELRPTVYGGALKNI